MAAGIRMLVAAAAALLAAAQPAPGPVDGVIPVFNLGFGLRHCNYVASACPFESGNLDFSFTVVAPLNGAAAPAFSIQSANYPTMYIGVVNMTSGAVGLIGPNPNADDATWSADAPMAPPPGKATDAYSVRSLSKTSWGGKYLYYSTATNAPCNYAPPSGDALLVDSTGPGLDPKRMTWLIGSLPPANTSVITIDAGNIINPSVNRKIMGCHHDYGFAQAPRGFYAGMVYGTSLDPAGGTCSVPAWTTRTAAGTDASTGMTDFTSFSSKPSMGINLNTGAQVAQVNRGLCGAGMVFQAGQPYTVETWIWTGGQTTAFVELRDFTTNTSLARQDFTVVATGPSWGSTWIKYNFTLTPSASTTCTGIPFGSDPTIDCGGDAGPAHVCVRCGGEFLIGLSASGAINVGYVNLMPGPWGLLAGPNGPLPVLKSGADLLTQMGVSIIRSGGTVSQSMRWKDWRGVPWNRPSNEQVWGSSLLAGWGPFEVIDMCNALGIEPVITLAYDTNDALDWAELVEYAWGDATTAWGARRIADGHPAPYNITTFELGNEQYNPDYLQQVAAMEARSKAVNSPPLRYAFPDNGGLNAADAQLAMSMGLPIDRLMPDLHVGAGGAVEAAQGLFANPPVNGFNQSATNFETNAGTHDMTRALNEAADLIDWFTADPAITNRIYARTASFCTGSSNAFDQWDQGITFFLPNMTWFQPPGYVHVMVTNTWAEQTVAATWTSGSNPNLHFAAQKTADGKTLVLRAVTGAAQQPVQISWTNAAAAGPSYTLWTLHGPVGGDNTPSNPTAISPQSTSVPITAGATSIAATLNPNTFAIMVVPLQ